MYGKTAATLALLAGLSTPLSADTPITTFDFESGTEGWIAGSPGGPVFTAPGNRHDSGLLILSSTNNTNTFGFWDSPRINPVPSPAPKKEKGVSPILNAEWEVRTDVLVPGDVPQFRLRTTKDTLDYTNVSTVSSVGPSTYVPDLLVPPILGEDKQTVHTAVETYMQKVLLLPDASDYFFSFDILNVDPSDAANGEVALESLTLSTETPPQFPATEIEADYDFTEGLNGFVAHSPSQAQTPIFVQDGDGLNIRAKSFKDDGKSDKQQGTFYFGSWEKQTDIEFQEGDLYALTFAVTADEPILSEVPTFRLRVNDSTFQGSWYLNLSSVGPNPRLPTGTTGAAFYSLLIEAPAALNGNKMLVAFDYLNVGQNSLFTDVTLQSLAIERFED